MNNSQQFSGLKKSLASIGYQEFDYLTNNLTREGCLVVYSKMSKDCQFLIEPVSSCLELTVWECYSGSVLSQIWGNDAITLVRTGELAVIGLESSFLGLAS